MTDRELDKFEQYRAENREDHGNIFKELKSLAEKVELWAVSQGNKLGDHDGQLKAIWIGLLIIAGCLGFLFTR